MGAADYLKDSRILVLIVIAVALLALDATYGLHLGIEFAGGTQIPVTLEHSVNSTTLESIISDLEQRLSTFGLSQVTVEGLGSSSVLVTIPTLSSSDINRTIGIIESQGSFIGVVNGTEALNGSGILKQSIGTPPPIQASGTVEWQVSFFITQAAAANFARAAFGQADRPLFMFLDRPSNAIIIANESLLANATDGVSQAAALPLLQRALQLGSRTIPVLTYSNTSSSTSSVLDFLGANPGRYSTIITSNGIGAGILSYAREHNYTVRLESAHNMTPAYEPAQLGSTNQSWVTSWPAVGLLSAPVLQPSTTTGNISTSYEITGQVPFGVPPAQMLPYAQNQTKTIASILSGGALPVALTAGTPYSVPPTLGSHFLYISGIAGIIAVLFVSAFIVLRYRHAFLVVPILLTTLMELFIIVSIIGLIGTIDLAAVAGMIAVVGTGVDAQIIITDEILAKHGVQTSARQLLGSAFYIIWADAALLVIAMLPLFFSTSLVDVIGFSESTIIGALLGVLVTRPAYGAIVSRHYK